MLSKCIKMEIILSVPDSGHTYLGIPVNAETLAAKICAGFISNVRRSVGGVVMIEVRDPAMLSAQETNGSKSRFQMPPAFN